MTTPIIRPTPVSAQEQLPSAYERFAGFMARRWLTVLVALMGLYVGLPWLAPVFMRIGWTAAGNVLYAIYSTQCHQLPERSYFLFGPKVMYSLAEIQAAWQTTNDPMILRQFVGNAAMGWKVAWSDRMVSMYTSVWLAAVLYPLWRRRLPELRWWGLVLLLLPMAVDGTSHFFSDLLGDGVGLGFRDSNLWLANLNGNRLPAAFYAGDAIGSFNWLMRLLSGLLFGLGVTWFSVPYLADLAGETRREIEARPHPESRP